MDILEQIKQVAPTAKIENGKLILDDPIGGADFAKVSNIWNGDIDAKHITGEFNMSDMPTNAFFNIKGTIGEIRGDITKWKNVSYAPK